MIRFWLNGQPVEEDGLSPTTTLLQYLRLHRHDTGTKEGCAEGDCGACTVALLDPEGPDGPTYRGVNACLLLLPMVHGRHVVTVEGLHDEVGPH
ncbi:MAG: 2Fe-2S iron-sulfur cluster-binding protein, partial [Myxococcota bacterium]|nr:2Fe-2S iron-sulfur cluster-binding protein [Myxococcota bacterium]